MSVTTISSAEDFESAINKDQLSGIWVFDSDGANRGFGKKYEEYVATEIKEVQFYKAGTDDVKDAMKKHGLAEDNVYFFKGGKQVQEAREDHNLVYKVAKDLL